jgi:fumarate reductase subunit D
MRHHGIGWWAALGHRLSGLALAIFLPLHFLALGLALEGAGPLDGFLRFAELPLVKAAELGLVMLLSLHFVFGLRVLAIELLPWPARGGLRARLVYAGLAAMVVAGVAFGVGIA